MASTEERGLERIILFSDAVVAIAITLLVLPLADLQPEEGQSALSLVNTHRDEFVAFAVSFVVIARFWISHHRMFKVLVRHDGALLVLNMAWLASVVIMPFTTAVVDHSPGYASLYLLNLLLTSLLTVVLASYVHTHPDLVETPLSPTMVRRNRMSGLALVAGIAVALIASFFLDHAALWFLLLIPLLTRVADRGVPDEVTV